MGPPGSLRSCVLRSLSWPSRPPPCSIPSSGVTNALLQRSLGPPWPSPSHLRISPSPPSPRFPSPTWPVGPGCAGPGAQCQGSGARLWLVPGGAGRGGGGGKGRVSPCRGQRAAGQAHVPLGSSWGCSAPGAQRGPSDRGASVPAAAAADLGQEAGMSPEQTPSPTHRRCRGRGRSCPGWMDTGGGRERRPMPGQEPAQGARASSSP